MSVHPRTRALVLLRIPTTLVAALLAFVVAAHAQDPPVSPQAPPAAAPAAAPAITAAEIESRIQALTEAGLDDATRTAVVAVYQEALAQLRRADEAAVRTAEFTRHVTEAPGLLATIRAELAAPPAVSEPTVPAEATLPEIERSLTAARTELDAARRQYEDLQREANRRDERRTTITTQLAEARKRLTALDESLLTPPAGDDPAPLQAARRAAVLASRAATIAEISSLESEAASYDARRELLPLRRDRATRRVTEFEQAAAAWERITNQRRQADARQAEAEARRASDAARQHKVLEKFAEVNAALAGVRTGPTGLTDRIAATTSELRDATTRVTTLRTEFVKLRRLVEASGMNRSAGVLLRRHLEKLPTESGLRRRIREVDKIADDAGYELVLHQESRDGVGDVNAVVRDLVERVRAAGGPPNLVEIEQVATELATARKGLLDAVIADYVVYLRRLTELDIAIDELYALTQRQRDYVEERILWGRSIKGTVVPSVPDAAEAVVWLTHVPSWTTGLRAALAEFKRPQPWLVGTLVVLLFGLRFWARRDLVRQANVIDSTHPDSFLDSLRAAFDTLLSAAAYPALLHAVSWLLLLPSGQPAVVVAVALALETTALYVALVTLARAIVRRRGLAECHFRWPVPAVESLRRHFGWFLYTTAPLVVLIFTLDRQANEFWNDALGRVAFSAGMIVLAVSIHRVIRPGGPLLRDFVARHPAAHQSTFAWYGAAVLAPIVLMVLALVGYYYTALRLAEQVIVTLGLVLAVAFVAGLAGRWLFVARRHLAIEDARRQREQAGIAAPDASAEGATVDEDRIDIPAIDAQTQRLFRTVLTMTLVVGLYFVWAEVLPALRVLDRVQVWPRVVIVEPTDTYDEELPSASLSDTGGAPAVDAGAGGAGGAGTAGGAGNGGSVPVTPAMPGRMPSMTPQPAGDGESTSALKTITLADIGLAVIILLVTVAAVRNLPALVEIAALRRLPLDAGSRYALGAVLRYLILIVGFVAASGALSVSWSKVQWLVAALMFGLAFGLQEIFANLISGLIILAERPIRVGDVVTVGGVSGTVTRIRMRATTILDFDRKELLVPNKAFVTDQVINWTLSDPTLRLVVPVGLGYGADIDKAESLLREIANADHIVLAEPAASAVFMGFGESCLNFELRVFIPHIEHLVQTRHRLHRAIIKAFREAGIEIAFPQRDLHLRTADGLRELVQKREDVAAEDVSGPT